MDSLGRCSLIMEKREKICLLGIEFGESIVRFDDIQFGILYLEKFYPSKWFRTAWNIPVDFDYVSFKLNYSTGEVEIKSECGDYSGWTNNVLHVIKWHPLASRKKQKIRGQPMA